MHINMNVNTDMTVQPTVHVRCQCLVTFDVRNVLLLNTNYLMHMNI
jgi:hypothetical protein